MSRRTLYLIFIAKFLFSIALIAWTITMTLGAGVGKDDDNTFMGYYHDIDTNYNDIVTSNALFEKKYNLKIKINDLTVNSLSYEDIYFSQRVIKDRKTRKNILHIGENKVSIMVVDKVTKEEVKNIDAKVLFSMPSTHKFNQEIALHKSEEEKIVSLSKKSYWNVMGTIKVGENTGHFCIKTNAI